MTPAEKLEQFLGEEYRLRLEVAQLRRFIRWRAGIKPLKPHRAACPCKYCENYNTEQRIIREGV